MEMLLDPITSRSSPLPLRVVNGSVGPETGDIHFTGDVEIAGGVADGYRVRTTGRVVVGKSVGMVEIEAGGDIEIHGGMAGHGAGSLISGGDVRIRFLQEAVVDARGSVRVSGTVIHSTIESGSRIIVGTRASDLKGGVVIGGLLRAFSEVTCRTLGTVFATKTSVEVGADPRHIRQMEKLNKTLTVERENLANVRKGVDTLKALSSQMGGLPAEKEQILRTLMGVLESIRGRVAGAREELRALETEKDESKVAGRVSVAGTAHPGVRIIIGASALILTKPIDHAIFFEEESKIGTRAHQCRPHSATLAFSTTTYS